MTSKECSTLADLGKNVVAQGKCLQTFVTWIEAEIRYPGGNSVEVAIRDLGRLLCLVQYYSAARPSWLSLKREFAKVGPPDCVAIHRGKAYPSAHAAIVSVVDVFIDFLRFHVDRAGYDRTTRQFKDAVLDSHLDLEPLCYARGFEPKVIADHWEQTKAVVLDRFPSDSRTDFSVVVSQAERELAAVEASAAAESDKCPRDGVQADIHTAIEENGPAKNTDSVLSLLSLAGHDYGDSTVKQALATMKREGLLVAADPKLGHGYKLPDAV